DIAEIIVYNRTLTAAERANVENYLGNKYAIQTSGTSAPFFDKLSASDAGFLNTVSGGDLDPFTQNNKISFTVQAGDALLGGTYYWRARGKDPAGSATWGDWAVARSFIISTGPILQSLTGTLSFVGSLIKQIRDTEIGALSFVGNLPRQTRDTET